MATSILKISKNLSMTKCLMFFRTGFHGSEICCFIK